MTSSRIRMVVPLAEPIDIKRARAERDRFTKKLWWEKNKHKRSAYFKAWKARNKEHEAARKKVWRLANLEHIRAYNRRYYELHPNLREYRTQKNREYRQRDAT